MITFNQVELQDSLINYNILDQFLWPFLDDIKVYKSSNPSLITYLFINFLEVPKDFKIKMYLSIAYLSCAVLVFNSFLPEQFTLWQTSPSDPGSRKSYGQSKRSLR